MILCKLLLIISQAWATIPGLSTAYTRHIRKTQHAILTKNLLNDPSPKTCHAQISALAQKKTVDIHVAFGYMDVSSGQDFNDSGTQLYGLGDVLDRDAKEALEAILTSSCLSQNGVKLQACGFSQSGNTLTKRVKNRFTGQNINFRITLDAPSISGKDKSNRQSQKQLQSSERSRRSFMSALQNKDVVLYLGHARSGGGPDFLPPLLTSQGRVNYPLYRSEQSGIRDVLGALKGTHVQPAVLGVLACKSTGLFANRIRAVAPSSILVTAGELFDYNDILPTGYAMIEALVSQRCTESFGRVVKVQPASAGFLNVKF